MSTEVNKVFILKTVKKFYNFKKDSDFARFLGIAPQTLASWYKRKTFDIWLLSAKCEEIDGNFILTGTGEVAKSSELLKDLTVESFGITGDVKKAFVKLIHEEIIKFNS